MKYLYEQAVLNEQQYSMGVTAIAYDDAIEGSVLDEKARVTCLNLFIS